MIKTRIATVWDAQTITGLWAKLMNEVQVHGRYANAIERGKFFISILTKIKQENSLVVVSEVDDKIVGFASGYMHYYEYGTSSLIGTCDNIYIEKEYRGNEAMDNMLDMLITYAKSYGVKELEFLTVYDPRLIKFWGRKGFTPVQVTYIKEV